MIKPIEIKVLPEYNLWIKFSDGIEGKIDLSNLAGKGIFLAWNDYDFFKNVSIDNSGAITWSPDIELCPDALYIKISGKSVEEVFPNLKKEKIYA